MVPAVTVAVSVRTLLQVTEVTALPSEVTARVVAVADLDCAEPALHGPHTVAASTRHVAVNLPRLLREMKILEGRLASIEEVKDRGMGVIEVSFCET